MWFKIIVFWLFASLSFPAVPRAQTPDRPARPTVGLVLSGGGARGFAHIGVLKVLEANRIPVDYIGGASMGGLVGALYALGKTPAEMEELVAGLDWGKLLQPAAPFENLSFRRKEDRRNIPAPIVLKGNVKDLKLPNALNSGHEIGLLLDRLTLPAAGLKSFDELPVPFRTVGTDMVNGSSVALKDGSLARALRATMSIPGVFSPVEIDGRVLADGGLVNNIPTDLVKAMGADIILVVNIETQPGTRETLESLPGVLAQTISISTLDNSRRSLREADFIIAPDLENFTIADFAASRRIIELGERGAEKKIKLLENLALDEAAWRAHLENRRRRAPAGAVKAPAFVAVEGEDDKGRQAILEKLGDKYDAVPFDQKQQSQLEKDLSDLTGTGRFDALNYTLAERGGRSGLLITENRLGAKASTPTRLELGFDVNSVESDNVNFNFLARLTFFDVGRYGAEWRNDLRLGSNTLLATEYYRPLGRTGFFVAPRASYERRRINVFERGNRLAEYVAKTVEAGVDLGYGFNPRSELRAGYAIGYQSGARRIGDPLLPNIKGRFSVASLRWVYDGLDKAQVPTRGLLARSSLNYFFDSPEASGRFTQAETTLNYFKTVPDNNIFFAFGGGGTTAGAPAAPIRQFTLGGPFRLGGYGFEEFRADHYLLAGAGVLHNPKFLPAFLGGRIYLGAWYEGGSAFEKFSTADYRQSVSAGTIVETPLGPVFFGGSFNESRRGRLYFSFGRFFR